MASRKRPEPAQDDRFNPEVKLMLPVRLAIEGKAVEARGLSPRGGARFWAGHRQLSQPSRPHSRA